MRALIPLLALPLSPLFAVAPDSAASAAVSVVAVTGSYEAQATGATNTHRDRHDLRTLRSNACLNRFATRQARRMADQRRVYHQDLSPVLRRCNLSRVGENVAAGFSNGRRVVDDGWMESPPHRDNILTRSFRITAVSAVRSDSGRWYTAQVLGRR